MSSFISDLQAAAPVEITKPAVLSPATEGAKKVRLGGMGPCFIGPSIADAGKVRLGGMGPTF